MKTIFKSLIVALTMLVGVSMSAQNRLSYEVTAGVGFSDWNMAQTLVLNGVGFRAGAIAQYNIPQVENLYANAGLLFTLEGGKYSLMGVDLATISPFYLNVPVHVGYQYNFFEQLGVFAEAGPYVGVGLFGSVSAASISSEEISAEPIPAFGEEGGLSRVQFGLGFKVGLVAFKNYKLSFGWDWNLLNGDATNSTKVAHSNGYLGLSYMF